MKTEIRKSELEKPTLPLALFKRPSGGYELYTFDADAAAALRSLKGDIKFNAKSQLGSFHIPSEHLKAAREALSKTERQTKIVESDSEPSSSAFALLSTSEKFAFAERYFVQANAHNNRAIYYYLMFCQSLYLIRKTLQHGECAEFYSRIGVSERTAEKWRKVGQSFNGLISADVGGFSKSQLEVVATLPRDAREVILARGIKGTVRAFYAVKKRESELRKLKDHDEIAEAVIKAIETIDKKEPEHREYSFHPEHEQKEAIGKPEGSGTKGAPIKFTARLQDVCTHIENCEERVKKAIAAIRGQALESDGGDRNVLFDQLKRVENQSASLATQIENLREAADAYIGEGEVANENG